MESLQYKYSNDVNFRKLVDSLDAVIERKTNE